MFSEKFFCCTRKIHKRILKTVKWTILYIEVTFSVTSGVIPIQSMGLPIFNLYSSKIRVSQSVSEKIRVLPSINIVWYTDGQYQGGTKNGCKSVNLFDPETNIVAVYEKQSDGSHLFLTTCKLTPLEIKHLNDSR